MLKNKTFIFAWRRPPPPLFIGGAEITQNLLAERLASLGANVFYIGSLEDPQFPSKTQTDSYLNDLKSNDGVNKLKINSDDECSFQYNSIECAAFSQSNLLTKIKNFLDTYRDAYLITSQEDCVEIIETGRYLGLTTIGWVHSISEVGTSVVSAKPDFLLSTSQFTSDFVKTKFGIASRVFYPSFKPSQNLVSGDYITLINPIEQKGSDLFLQIASEMPQSKFLAVEGWYENSDFIKKMPNNVSYLKSQSDMSQVWEKTKILLAPSIVEEAFGRVVVEAGLNRIPSITSKKGGLTEALNGSGICLDNYNVTDWVQAIERLDTETILRQEKEIAKNSAQMFIRDIGAEFHNIIEGHEIGYLEPRLV